MELKPLKCLVVALSALVAVDNAAAITPITSLTRALIEWSQDKETATTTYGPIGDWDTKDVEDFDYAFNGDRGFAEFNEDITRWNTGKGTSFLDMFVGCTKFNQPIGKWNMTSATDLGEMFYEAVAFNQPLNEWDTSSVANYNRMFGYAGHFNQPLNEWDITAATDLGYMFEDAYSFNQPINDWNTENVTDFRGIFSYANAFNQPLDKWVIASDSDRDDMFNDATTMREINSCDADGPPSTCSVFCPHGSYCDAGTDTITAACAAITGAATVACTNGTDSVADTAVDGYYLALNETAYASCTSECGGDDDDTTFAIGCLAACSDFHTTPTVCDAITNAATVTCTEANASVAVTAVDGYYLDDATPTDCEAVDNAATVTCTEAGNSVAVTAVDGYYLTVDVTTPTAWTNADATSCADGSVWTAGSTTADSTCVACSDGTFSASDNAACAAWTNADAASCADMDWTAGSTTSDSTCVAKAPTSAPTSAPTNSMGVAQTKTLTITMDLDGIDLSTLDAEGFAAIETATEEMAKAQGIDMKDVSEIIYKQNGKVVKAPTATTKNRRASGDITMEFVFKAGATVDVDALVKGLDAAIKAKTVKFSVEIDGKTIEAKGFAAAAVDVKSGIVKSGASTTGFATGLIAMLATVATLL